MADDITFKIEDFNFSYRINAPITLEWEEWRETVNSQVAQAEQQINAFFRFING